MSESSDKCRKRYVDHLKDGSKYTCLIHVPGHSSDKLLVLREFGSKYSKSRHTKERGHDHATGKRFNQHSENNDIVNQSVY